MQVLVRDLLAYARVGQTRPVGRPIDLERHVQASLAALSDEIRDARATVRIGELPWVEADPVLLDQVLENILSNALKFRRPGVRHKVTISGDRSRGDDGRSWTRLVVEDNGIGFDPDYTDRIFEMFERLGDRKAYEGTGVGLAIVRRIVERLEGHVAAEGRPGRGSTFTILLPAADRLEEAA